jgi:site-specific recombinase XerD
MPQTAPEAAPLDWRGALERLRGAFAESSLAAYAHHFGKFESWCGASGLTAAPAEPSTVAAYLADSCRLFRSSTVTAQMHAIRRVHRAMRVADPTVDEDVWLTLRRGRKGSAPPRQARPINAALRDRMAGACPDTMIGLRDSALIWMAYDTLCRRFELVELRVEDLEPLPNGTARIRVRGGKQDLGGEGDDAYLSADGLAAVRRWLEAANLHHGHILRTVMKGQVGARIRRPGLVNLRIAAMAIAAGVSTEEAAGLSAHSTRVGAAQDLAAAGFSLMEVMRAGRWRNPHHVMRYIQKAPVNVWAPAEGDGFPLAAQAQSWRRRKLAARHAAGKGEPETSGVGAKRIVESPECGLVPAVDILAE